MRKPFTAAAPLLALFLTLGSTAQAAPHAHEHGVARLAIAIDGSRISIDLDAPLDGLLGFERAPRNDAERKAAADLLARLRAPAVLFVADAAAGCRPGAVTIDAPVLQPDAKAAAGKPGGEHADLEAQFEFDCAKPQVLRSLDIGLFEAFSRLQRVEVQVAGAKGQWKAVLKRPARSVRLVP